jgi:hypothetical protein
LGLRLFYAIACLAKTEGLFQACAGSWLLTDSSDAFDGVLGSGVVGNAEVGMAVGAVWEDSWGKGGCADWIGLDSGVFCFV